MKTVVNILFILLGIYSYAQEITDIYIASSNCIVVQLESDWINIKENNRQTSYEDFRIDTSGWIVNDQVITNVGVASGIIDEQKAIRISGELYFPVKMQHKVYLTINETLTNDQDYLIKSNFGDTSFTFSQNTIFCESIKVNQVGYNVNSTIRYANFGIFKGDQGSTQLAELPIYMVKDSASNTVYKNGTVEYWGDDTGREREQSGEHVYRIDLTELPEGKYYIELVGIGRSYYFGVGLPYSRKIAATHLRGLYHQRCGIALEKPFTNFQRGLCHHEVAFTKDSGNGNEGQGWIQVPPNTPIEKVIGGYHDAGDYDRRVYHTIIPLLMLNYFEAFQDHFKDKQYNIPESGNGIPDFFDETLWGIKIWEQLQLDSTNTDKLDEYGGVMGGTETNAHPIYGIDRADIENNGESLYGTYDIYESTSIASAGFFAQAARLLAPYDAQKSAEFLDRAIAAWNFCKNHDLNTRLGFRMYAALQLYLATATGDNQIDLTNSYHLEFLELAKSNVIEKGTWPYQYLPGNSSARITTAHFVAYLLTNYATDATIADGLFQRIKEGADTGGYMGWTADKYPYPQGVTKFISFGAGTAQGRYADPAAFMYALSTDPTDKQHYFNIVSQLGDYSLGLNPLGQSYVTGLGTKQVQSPLHLDSYWTKYGELPNGDSQPIIGNIPGIVIYGYADGRSMSNTQTAVSDYLYPAWQNLPGQRRWTDGWSLIASNEFSTWETMVWNTCMYAVLYNANNDSTVTTEKNKSITQTKPTIYPNPAKQFIQIEGVLSNQKYELKVYDIVGKSHYHIASVQSSTKGRIAAINVNNLKAGVYLIVLRNKSASYTGRVIIQ